MKSGIYKIVNVVNGKQYVGSAADLDSRKGNHWYTLRQGIGHNSHLQAAWNKYGENSFEFRIIGKCPPERLVELEQEVIDHLKPEYNIRTRAHSCIGIKHSSESKQNMSRAQSNRTLETRQKIRIAHLGMRSTLEARQKMSKAKLGRRHTAEARQKMSRILLGNTRSLGRRHSPETRQKMSAAQKARWARRKAINNE